MKVIYQLKSKDATATLNELRYRTFRKVINLATLPPTDDAAPFHVYRAYYQVQTCLGQELDPTKWGWKRNIIGMLEPFVMMRTPSPDSLQHLISNNCTKGCRKACSYQRAGINMELRMHALS